MFFLFMYMLGATCILFEPWGGCSRFWSFFELFFDLYVLSALRLSVTWTLLDVFGKVTGLDSVPLTVGLDLTLGTLIFALFDMLINEKQIRAYRREQARLDAEENAI